MFQESLAMSEPTLHENNRAFYDRIAHAYDLIADDSERPARLAGVQAIDLKPGERVLEIGFGTGNEIIDLSRLVGDKGAVAGIDISSGMLAVTQKKLAGQNLPAPLDLLIGDARTVPWPDESFDAVYTSFTLELFPEQDISTVLKEVRRVLKTNGRVGVVSMATVKAGQSPSVLERTYIWMHRHFPHLVDCRPIDPAALIKAAGFTVKKTIDLEIWTMPVAVVVGEKTS
jgi:demethylmenaquinone methyltransferase/2-methoxy-6-polyprenyl-1,4-benzoquinol methylase